MRHHNLQVTGSVVVNGLGVATASELTAYTASTDAKISTLQAFTASTSGRLNSIESVSASNIARINSLETTSASVDTLNTTQNNRLNSLENLTGSLATTGSNTFYGQQVFSGSLYVQDNLIVQGSSSLQNITASAVSIGTNIVYLNTDTPAVRFAGLTVQDSGSSAGVTGSMLWDSLCNRWIYSNPSTIGYSGGMLLSGPRTQTLGTEPTLTCNYIAKSGGGDHLYDSCIFDNGNNVTISTNVGVGGASATYPLTAYNSANGTTTAFGGTDYGIRIDNGGTYSAGRSTIFGVDDTFYNSYQPLSIEASTLVLQDITGGNVGIGVSTPCNALHVRRNVTGDVTLARFTNSPGTGGEGAFIGFETGYAVGLSLIGARREGAENDASIIFAPMLNEAACERMRITSVGNVGINITTPSVPLHVLRYAGSSGTIILEGNDTVVGLPSLTLKNNNGNTTSYIGMASAGGGLNFNGNAVITSTGNMAIGHTSPQAKLDICEIGGNGLRSCTALYLRAGNNSDIFCSNQILFGYNGTANYAHAIKTRHNSNGFCDNAIDFYTWKCGDALSTPAGQYVMTIAGDGRLGIGTCIPSTLLDARCSVAENVNGSVLNSHPIATFAVNASGGGQRGLQFGGPTGGIVSPVFLKVFGTGNRFAILNESNCENLTVTSGGQVRKPFQPAFQVYRAQGADCFITNTAEMRLTFQCIRYDVGSNTSSSGIFTAPLCGRYSFSSTVRYDGASTADSYLRLFFAVNGCSGNPGFTYGHAIAGPGSYSTSYHSMSISAVLNLNVGDTVSVGGGINTGCVGLQFESQFSGYFVG